MSSENVVDAITNAGSVVLPTLMAVEEIGDFLSKHASLIKDITEAFQSGATHDQIRAGIRASMLTASDAVMEAELGPRP